MLSLTIANVNFPFRAELVSVTTRTSQLSGKELNNNKACNSSFKVILLFVSWFTVS
ncbi:uncharacterized protein DS421_20g679730 [Arachis hypogaea]|nr:uncharacterized protein DS421_20g679730 [Arachis hypogaea]